MKCATCGFESPKEWDAETIKDAPEGEYRLHESNHRGWVKGFLYSLESVKSLAVHYEKTDAAFKAFGPIPLPGSPASQPTGEGAGDRATKESEG